MEYEKPGFTHYIATDVHFTAKTTLQVKTTWYLQKFVVSEVVETNDEKYLRYILLYSPCDIVNFTSISFCLLW